MDMDGFYQPVANDYAQDASLLRGIRLSGILQPWTIAITTIMAWVLITATVNGLLHQRKWRHEKAVWMVPYYFPLLGHSFSFFWDPMKLMTQARDRSQHGIFALKMGTRTLNVVSDPHLVKELMEQRESTVSFQPIAWTIVQRFFGIPKRSKKKYFEHWEELNSSLGYLMKEPYLGHMTRRLAQGLQQNIPQMISFVDTEVDLQPWERWAHATHISATESELSLMPLLHMMMGAVSVPAIFGTAFMEKYPEILQCLLDMDKGMNFFLMGLPAWFPWPGLMKAHIARYDAQKALEDFHQALDDNEDGRSTGACWDDLGDCLLEQQPDQMVLERGFEIRERGDLSILWALVINANLLVFWQVLYIYSTPGLLERLRAEIAPYAPIAPGISIGNISELPKITLSPEQLARQCPLLKSTYLEALRMVDQPRTVRAIAKDVLISGNSGAATIPSFVLREGEYVTVPHDLHMRDPQYFADPATFDPERFLAWREDGSLTTEIGTTRPYGGGSSMCKGRVFAERECLALVAGIVAYWDIEPADVSLGWVIPKQQKTSAIARPVGDTRVRIKRRLRVGIPS